MWSYRTRRGGAHPAAQTLTRPRRPPGRTCSFAVRPTMTHHSRRTVAAVIGVAGAADPTTMTTTSPRRSAGTSGRATTANTVEGAHTTAPSIPPTAANRMPRTGTGHTGPRQAESAHLVAASRRRPSPRRPSVRGVVAERPRGADSQTAVGVRPRRPARGVSRRGKLGGQAPIRPQRVPCGSRACRGGRARANDCPSTSQCLPWFPKCWRRYCTRCWGAAGVALPCRQL